MATYARKVAVAGGTEYLVTSPLFVRLQPSLLPCTAGEDGACATVNTNMVLGMTATSLAIQPTQLDFNVILDAITAGDFRVLAPRPFYAFVYTTSGECVAHGGNPSNVGKSLTEIVAGLGITSITGAQLNARLLAASQAPGGRGGWAVYPWKTSSMPAAVQKAAYVLPLTDPSGAALYIGVGFDLTPSPASPVVCSAAYDAPCAAQNALAVAGHAAASALVATSAPELDQVWRNITAGAPGFSYPGNFYVFAYTDDGVCVAHGATASNVNRTLGTILRLGGITSITGPQLNAKFVAAAEQGGGYVSYPWLGVTTKLAYVTRVVSNSGQRYYVGSGFSVSPLPLVSGAAGVCDANVLITPGQPTVCAETAVSSAVGHAQALMNACGDNQTCVDGVLSQVDSTPRYGHVHCGSHCFLWMWWCVRVSSCATNHKR